VTWRRVERLAASWYAGDEPAPADSNESKRATGIASLIAMFRSAALAAQPSMP